MVKKISYLFCFAFMFLLLGRANGDDSKNKLEENLIKLGNFEEKDIKKYVKEKWALKFGEGATLTEEAAHSGKQSLKMRAVVTSKRKSLSINTHFCQVEAGKEYKVTFWAKAVEATGGGYVLFPACYFYKDTKPRPEYVGRVFHMIKTPTFDWQKIERIVTIPEGADLLRLHLTTLATVGDLYIDDISIVPVSLDTKKTREERARFYYSSLSTYLKVNEEYETPHTKWLKPSFRGKTKVLFLSYIDRLDDIRKRDVIELNQRVDMDYKFIPLLPMKGAKEDKSIKGLEPYVLDVVEEELKKDYDVIVINKLNFKDVQVELSEQVMEEVKKGKGLLMLGCTNLPSEVKKELIRKNSLKLPSDFNNIPKVNASLEIEPQISRLCKVWQVEKGRVSTIDERDWLYPCVPADKARKTYINYLGREIPYWEYKFFPIIKSICYISGKESDVDIKSFAKADKNIFKFKIGSKIDFSGLLEVIYNDIYGQIEKREKYPIKVVSGDNDLSVSIPKLSGGQHISDYRLMDSKGLIYDFGSYYFEMPLVSEIKQVKFKTSNPYYKTGEEIKAELDLANISEGVALSWYVEDTYNRVIKEGRQPLKAGQVKTDIKFKIEYPLTILYRLFVKLEKGNELENISMGEFSMPFNLPPSDELVGCGWFTSHGAYGFKRWAENGFSSMISSFRGTPGNLFEAQCNANMRPLGYGLLYKLREPARGVYRGDHGTEGDDVIRKPCYSDPDYWVKMKEVLSGMIKSYNAVYYGIKDYSLGDECYLGANVCFSEWCLKDFREYLKKDYKNIQALNKSWSTSFKSWNEVVPLKIKEIDKDKSNMSAWLDHKMFMTTVFANLGKRIKNIVEEAAPDMDIRVGFSGMQNPGYSYNWWELMKTLTSVQHYSGIQEDLIRSFNQPGTSYGMWVGYSPESRDSEKYARHHIWKGLFNQANSHIYYYSGYAMLGDLSFANNLKYVFEEFKEAREGIDKMLLSSELITDIGIHYSHNSMFACVATKDRNTWLNALNSWKAIINDLGVNFKFVSREQLEVDGLDKNKYKVFILPVSLCLSDKEIVALRKYVESGGVLVADYGAGIYDEHGKKRDDKQLRSLFGFEREDGSVVSLSGSKVKVSRDMVEGFQEREMKLRFGEKGIKLTSGKAYGDTGDAKAPAVIVNRVGSGKTVFLNCVINDYSQVTLIGGGEVSEVKKGVLEVNEQVKGLAREIFSKGNVTPDVLFKTSKGVDLQLFTKTSVWKNGQINYVGLLYESGEMFSRILPEEITEISILFKDKGHLYDVRERKYLGLISGDKEIKTKLTPARAKIFSILPYKIDGLEVVSSKKEYRAGEVITLSAKVKISNGQAGNHILYAEVLGPDKKVRDYYAQKVILQKGEGRLNIPTSYNDNVGKWSVNLKDVASGVSKTIEVNITQ